MDGRLDGAEREQVAGEAEPDHATGGAHAVDLRQAVPEHVGEREDHQAGGKDTAGDLDQLDGDDVRDDEGRHEKRRDDDEALGVPHPIRFRAWSISSSVMVKGGVALMRLPSSPAGTTMTPRSHA